MHCLSWFTGLMKDIHMWSKMAKGKGPKPPVFKYHNFYCSATHLKRQPSKGEGTKNAKCNGMAVTLQPHHRKCISFQGKVSSRVELQQK